MVLFDRDWGLISTVVNSYHILLLVVIIDSCQKFLLTVVSAVFKY